MQQVICRLDELADRHCFEFELQQGSETISAFVVRHGERVEAYRNRCPHTGAPLNWMQNEFLNYEQEFIQCAIHGALFRLEDGYCLHGPCNGQSLQAIALSIDEGVITVTIE